MWAFKEDFALTRAPLWQVGDVEAVFNALRADVEALFMTAPSVSLDAVDQGLRDMQAFADEQVCLFTSLFAQPVLASGLASWAGILEWDSRPGG